APCLGGLAEAELTGAAATGTAETRHAARERTEGAGRELVGLGLGVAVRRDDQVGEIGEVGLAVAVEAARADRDVLELADAVDGDRHGSPGDGPLETGIGEALLSALELLLHLLGLLEQALEVEAATATEGLEGVVGHGVTCRSLSGPGWWS